jgi:D-Tyr-tRNAtyr deacylase
LIDDQIAGQISADLLVLLCAEFGDSLVVADGLLAKILKLLIVSQFTLATIPGTLR